MSKNERIEAYFTEESEKEKKANLKAEKEKEAAFLEKIKGMN